MPARPSDARAATIALVAALLALTAWTCWQRYLVLAESPFPVGIDGYYYPIQLRALLERHALAYPDFPVAYGLMLPFAAATDPITGAKLAAAILGGLAVLPTYALGARLGRSAGAGLLAAALVATSAGSTYLAMEFVKNGVGITVALTAIWLVLRAADAPVRPGARRALARPVLAAVAVLAAAGTHKLAAALVLATCVPALLAALADRGRLRGRRLIYATLGTAAAFVASALVLAHDLLAGLVTATAQWSAPALAQGDRVLLAMGHEPLLGLFAGLAAVLVLARPLGLTTPSPATSPARVQSRATRVVAWVFALLGIAIGLPWLAVADPQGLGFRLRAIAFVPLALGAATAAGALVPFVAERLAAFLAPRDSALASPGGAATLSRLASLALAVVAAVLVVAMPRHRVEGRIVAHPAMVAAVQATAGDIPDGDVVITPERHIMFMLAWYTRAPVRLSPDAVPPARRVRAMPLAFIGKDSPLDQLLVEARREPSIPTPIGRHPRHPNGWVIVREATWTWLLDQLPPDARAHFAAWPTI